MSDVLDMTYSEIEWNVQRYIKHWKTVSRATKGR